MTPPDYFAEIRDKAHARWDQLEADPELAGPWHQLFKQVQSPRHVVSELLQNADDAGASEARVDIVDGEFVFSHNGEDFTQEHFASLCRFGYSNKRNLHTIGFRGIGFKSTFSLGEVVRLRTPTLSVSFRRTRFTEPSWNDVAGIRGTEIRVAIEDEHRLHELKKNLDDWLTSPASLLFFRSIRCLKVGDETVEWIAAGSGPVARSQWMMLEHEPQSKFLVVQSEEAPFPSAAVEEIRQERMVSADNDIPLPACRVELVLGMEGRLFVVLPTGVKTELPFACNAPFMQDPARVKIKDPDISPTNRWLLQRAGETAAEAMLGWLESPQLPLDERCQAYGLMPNVDEGSHAIEGTSGSIVETAFARRIDEEAVLLTDEGNVASCGDCIAVPVELLGVWSPQQVSKLFDDEARPTLCSRISAIDRAKLSEWGLLEEIDKSDVLNALESRHLPRPDSWAQLLALWAYVSEDVRGGSYFMRERLGMKILPVQGKDVLYASSEVVRLGEKRLLQSEADWEFLSEYLLVVNQNWHRFLAEQHRKADETKDDKLRAAWLAASGLLNKLGLDGASDPGEVVQQVVDQMVKEKEYPLEDCVRLAQIAAKLGAKVRERFLYVMRDGRRRPVNTTVVADVCGEFSDFVDDEWFEEHVLHDAYFHSFVSCTHSEWDDWILSGKSGLATFVPLVEKNDKVYGRQEVAKILKSRGVDHPLHFPYVTSEFAVKDWDFASRHWEHWKEQAAHDGTFWHRVLKHILLQPVVYWSKSLAAKVSQVATTGTLQSITHHTVLPAWVLELRGLPSLLDTRGECRQPNELLRRTPETEALLDVDPFVRAEDDNEKNRPLLAALGVGDTPTGPDRLLERLRTFSGLEDAPVYEVEKWCSRLDHLLDKCSTAEVETIRDAFASERLILTAECGWVTTAEVFLNTADDDVPGAPIVHQAIRQLSIWSKIGVADRPTADLAIDWLGRLGSYQKLTANELRRVRSLLPRFGQRIWVESGHWLNLDGQWVPVDDLEYALSMQSLTAWRHLFAQVKRKTADFQKLDAETCRQLPFCTLPTLASKIKDQFEETLYGLPEPEPRDWIQHLGAGIARIELDDDGQQISLRELGRRLAATRWQVATGLELVPYIDGTPAGASRPADVLWRDTSLYVVDRPVAQLFRSISQALAREFDSADIGEAIRACIDRSEEFIFGYLQENFSLCLAEEVLPLPEASVQAANDETATTQDESTNVEGETRLNNLDEEEPEADEQVSPVGHAIDGHSDESDLDADPGLTGPEVDEGGASAPVEEECNDESTVTAVPELPASRPTTSSAPKPKLIEQFAKSHNFEKDGSDRYYHADGGWLQRAHGNVFPWEQYEAGGELVQSFWLKECCLRREPLQLDAAIWSLCGKFPEQYSIVLRDMDDSPLVFSGKELKRLQTSGELTLHPATFRIVHRDGDNVEGTA